jgi:hypothetical protein
MVARNARLAQIVDCITRDFMGVQGAREILSAAMKDHCAMSELANLKAGSTDCSAARCGSLRDRILLTLVLYAMVRTGQALAGDQASGADSKLPDARAGEPLPSSSRPGSLLSTPLPTSLFSTDRSFADGDAFSATEFRPRRHSLSAAESAASEGFGANGPMLQNTSVWQRMTEYKSQDRVRVLTLLETRGSTVSLQAGKRGGPSLQWSSRRMNHDGATRGLLDRLVAAALRQTGNSPRPSPSRPVAAPAAIKPSNLSAAAGAQ